LISSQYISDWTIKVKSKESVDSSSSFLFPHKWFDIHGSFNEAIWSKSMGLVVHAIITRPGISRFQLLIQLRLVMDRSEVCTLINVACQAKVIQKVYSRDDKVRGEEAEWQAKDDRDLALIAVE